MSALSERIAVWITAAAVYRDRRVLIITFLGISSGFPLGVLGDPLSAVLKLNGISKETIGYFGLLGMPYAFKFLWAPIFERVRLPGLTGLLGRRRGWIVATQVALLCAIGALSTVDFARDIQLAAMITLAIAFFSASQDIVIDAYRVEALEERQLGAGAATIVFGYRIGQVGVAALGLIVASAYGWAAAFIIMAAFACIGVVAILFCPEPLNAAADTGTGSVGAEFRASVIAPMADFFSRPGWLLIFGVIVFYKLGDAVLSAMQTPFFIELGFTLPEIAGVKKAVGFAALTLGGVLGGILVAGWGIMRSLLLCGFLQALTNLVFVYQAWAGHDVFALGITVASENIATGMGAAAFVAYLSSLCNRAYTATQYALLTSVFGGVRTLLSGSSGWLADRMDWVSFFVLTTIAALPGLYLIWLLMRRYGTADVEARER